jgi:hypothetical protein
VSRKPCATGEIPLARSLGAVQQMGRFRSTSGRNVRLWSENFAPASSTLLGCHNISIVSARSQLAAFVGLLGPASAGVDLISSLSLDSTTVPSQPGR